LAVIDVDQRTGNTLSTQQTEVGLSKAQAKKVKAQTDREERTEHDTKPLPAKQPLKKTQGLPRTNQMDFYLGHLAECQSYLLQDIRYVCADAFYSKFKWVNGVVGLGLHAIILSVQSSLLTTELVVLCTELQ
jgi:uncharacterized membrane protein YcjF (UPF0283 family)